MEQNLYKNLTYCKRVDNNISHKMEQDYLDKLIKMSLYFEIVQPNINYF